MVQNHWWFDDHSLESAEGIGLLQVQNIRVEFARVYQALQRNTNQI